MSKKTFGIPDGFILGAASSAWQTEGWTGKNQDQDSYMDLWYKKTPELWHNGIGPAVATDFYNRYREDVDLMVETGLDCYRTSIDWSRFISDYENNIVNEEAAAYYDDLIDTLIAKGITPMICLEHYELPAYLFEKYGGWASRHVVDLYTGYSREVFRRYSNKVKYFMTFNEPIVVQTRIYLDSVRWPFIQDTKTAMQWNFHKILATASACRVYRAEGYNQDGGKIGVILNPEVCYPRSSAPHDVKAAEMFDLFFNRIYLDPSIKGTIPSELMEILSDNGCLFDHELKDLEVIRENTVDLVGINLYQPVRVKARESEWSGTYFHPKKYYEHHELQGRKMNPHRGWEICPRIMYDFGMRMKNEYGNIEWFIAENGMGVENEHLNKDASGVIQDDYRIEFISEHLKWLLKAVEEGTNCLGYMLWAFTDNVSPQNAFKNRYGLVEIDLSDNRNRMVKKSGKWFREISESRKFSADDFNFEYK